VYKFLASWRGILLEKLIVAPLAEKYFAFYGTEKFIAVVAMLCSISELFLF
jgi:hypothetical protein